MFVRKFPRQTLLSLLFAALLLSSCGGGATAAPTVDANAVSTAAVETAMAQLSLQFTQTAQAAPSATLLPTNTSVSLASPTAGGVGSPTTNPGALPTVSFNTNNTPVAGFTPLASPVAAAPTASLGDACNNNVFEADLTIPDGTVLKPGEDFKKVWQIKNTGSCTWDDGYALVFIGGDKDIDPVNFEITTENNGADFVSPGESADFDIPLTAPLKEGTYQGTWRMKSDSGYFFGTLLTVVIEVRK